MYENIIGQERIVSQLSSELRSGILPQALLFYGEPYTGKLSTALETSRILSCLTHDAPWNCGCRSCEQHRLLLHQHLLLLGTRYFDQEIPASADTLLRTGKDSAKYLFIRSVRKLLRRFDPVLWEGEEVKIQKIQPLIQSVEERLELFRPGREIPPERTAAKEIKAVVEECGKISSTLVSDNIPISLIRRVTYWSRISTPSERKIVILERADRMQENSRNALLKILEEPPVGVYFILLTERRSAVLPTILSRVRSYYFSDRNDSTARDVLTRIFREESGEYRNLRQYFLAWGGLQPFGFEHAAENFIHSILAGNRKRDVGETLRETMDTLVPLSDGDAFQYFLEELTRVLRRYLPDDSSRPSDISITAEDVAFIYGEIRRVARDHSELNVSAPLLLETLTYGISDLHGRGEGR